MKARRMTALVLISLAGSHGSCSSPDDEATPTSTPTAGTEFYPSPTEVPTPAPLVASGLYLVRGYTTVADGCSSDGFDPALEGTLVEVTAQGWEVSLDGSAVGQKRCLLDAALDPLQCEIATPVAYWDSWGEDESDWCGGTDSYRTRILAPARGKLSVEDTFTSLLALGYTDWPDRCYELECTSQVTYDLLTGETAGLSGSVTFRADTRTLADGQHALAEVRLDEDVFLVGDFTGWNPNYPGYEMEDPDGDGIYEITLQFPLEGRIFDGTMVGTPQMVLVGDTIQFKYAKTSSVPCDATSTSNYDGACWSEGQKYFLTAEQADEAGKACDYEGIDPDSDNLAGGGLWETGNYLYVVAEGPQTLETSIDAWKDTAGAYGYPFCD